ncbi:hypothetical protein QVA66_10155 [Staphylococcus chromogenes]|nr:hypothetical protein [Staphylococcus chromogenes]
MATLTIRNLDPHVHQLLKVRAAENSRSVEAEVRALIGEVVGASSDNLLVDLLHTVDGRGVDLQIPSRSDVPREADFS